MKRISMMLIMISLLLVGCGSKGDSVDELNGISDQEARDIVFKELGISENDAEYMKFTLDDHDRNSYKYEMEFFYDDYKYEYEVDAQGNIIKSEKEYLATDNTLGNISEEEALKIVFDHAEVLESEVEFLTVEKDYERNTYSYEIEFYVSNIEYDYEIGADGTVLKFEKDQK